MKKPIDVTHASIDCSQFSQGGGESGGPPCLERPEDSQTTQLLYRSFEAGRFPRFFINEHNNIILANSRARRLLRGHDVLEEEPFLHFTSKAAQQGLEAIIAAARNDGDQWQHKAVLVGEGRWARIFARCLDVTSGHVEVMVRQVEPPHTTSDIASVVDAFNLSVMEAKIVLGLVLNLPPKVIATRNNISVNTVRAYIRNIYAKFETRGLGAVQSLALQLSS